MNLRKNNGFTGVDISIAIIIMLIFVPTIFGSVYNIQKSNNMVKRESASINIATNVLEIAKGIDYSNLTASVMKTKLDKIRKYEFISEETIDGADILHYSTTGEDGEYYKIDVTISNYYPDGIEDTDKKDIVKKIDTVVTYTVAQKQKTVEISTVIAKN